MIIPQIDLTSSAGIADNPHLTLHLTAGGSAPGATVLAPASTRDLIDSVVRILGATGPSPEKLAEVLAQVCALVDDFAQVSTVRLTARVEDDAPVRVQASEMTVIPAE